MSWRPISFAPKDGTHVLLLAGDFGVVEGWWESSVPNFYKSKEGWASYDPENMWGDWVCNWHTGDKDYRLFCGATPSYWRPVPKLPRKWREI